MQLDARHLAAELEGTLHGDPATPITGVASVDTAEPGDLVFAEAPKYLQAAMTGRASAVLVTPELAAAVPQPAKALIAVAQPRHSFVQVLKMFAPEQSYGTGVHPTALVGERVRMGAGVHIAANAIIAQDTVLEDGVAILSGVSIGAGCTIGAGTIIHPNAVLYAGVKIGRACILHAGCVIGADGFGYVQIGYRHVKVPHLGTVEIGDDVEIGANTCIDRAKTGVTRIGAGTKIDNLVHIAHNVSLGQACLIIAQVGVAGSATIGSGVVLAGQAGIKDHVNLGDGARVGAQGGVIGDVTPGVTVSGYPARPHGEKMREYAAMAALPEALKRLRAHERRLSALEAARAPGEPEDSAIHSGDTVRSESDHSSPHGSPSTTTGSAASS